MIYLRYELKEFIRDVSKAVGSFLSERLLWLLIITVILFYILLQQLFNLQIIEAGQFAPPAPQTGEVTRTLPPLRGTIYDRHGRPLAINEIHFVVKMDPSVRISNEALLELVLLFEQNNEDFVDTFPISRNEPFEFTITGASDDIISRREYRWKADMAVPNPETATAEESWNHLRRQFGIDIELSNEDARRIMNFRSMIFQQRFFGFSATYEPTPITFAHNISQETIAAILEQPHFFTGLFIDTETSRHYPGGQYMSHMIGYLRQILPEQLETHGHLGYTAEDLFGRAGLERSMELALRGTPGLEVFQVDAAGRMIGSPIRQVDPIPGDRVFLTIDLELQMAAFYALEDALSRALIGRLNLNHSREPAVTVEEVLINFVNAHNLDIRAVMEAEVDNLAFPLREYVLEHFPEATTNANNMENRLQIQAVITEGVTSRQITAAQILLTLIGTGQITDPDGSVEERLITRPGQARDVLIEKINERELTPQLLNTQPVTGSIVLTCVNTGAVLAAATYPSYDNNRLANNFDNDYWFRINTLDPTHPMINRPFRETRAPGSTFKMITAVAALENGAITTNTRITDRVAFPSQGQHHVRCWHTGGGHGSINVAQAIAVSCNYFFADIAFRLGNGSSVAVYEGITTLNRYMEMFGLNDPTGVEIGEHPMDFVARGFEGNTMASPEFKRLRYLQFNPFAPASALDWRAVDTSQVSIGQGINNYTPAQMVRTMATIATRGTNYNLFLVSHREDAGGNVVSRTIPTVLPHQIEVSDTTWDAVIEGMRLVTQPGAGGTALDAFRNFPIDVAGKTGTAEEVGTVFSHSSFGAFAPIDDPLIAVYVNVPQGSTQAFRLISANLARDMIGITLGLGIEPDRPVTAGTLRR